jgi:hypothetical protein
LTDTEKILLARGLNFSLPLCRPRFCDFLAPFEKLYGILKKEPIAKKTINDFNEELIKTRIKDIALMGYKTYLIKPDKANGVVIINRTDYNRL